MKNKNKDRNSKQVGFGFSLIFFSSKNLSFKNTCMNGCKKKNNSDIEFECCRITTARNQI